MRRTMNVALVSLGLFLGTTGCNSFLTGDKLSSNPNLPTSASIKPQFVGVQAGQFAFQEGTVAMMMCEWVQACNATNSRFVQQAAQYVFGEASNIGANSGDWALVYSAGGLVDIRGVEEKAVAKGDSVWLGIAKIWEALTIGTASDMWGDIPYSEAGVNPQPKLDNRFDILNAIQTLLDQAIAELNSGIGAGPGDADLVLHGDAAKWVRVAHTLKARYYMHTAESLGTPAYQNAITEALQGINDATGGSDFASFHTTATSERNMWAQFQTSSGFGPDLQAGRAMVDVMNARLDPRLSAYFCPNVTEAWQPSTAYTAQVVSGTDTTTGSLIVDSNGFLEEAIATTGDKKSGTSAPSWSTTVGGTTTDNHVTWQNMGPPYAGDDYNTPSRFPTSKFNCGLPARFKDDARIPYVSYAENELILAEAYQQTGNDALALQHLNNARAFANAAYPHSPPLQDLPALVGITTATGLLDSIMVEKWIALFQNIETINDYRRGGVTIAGHPCIPRLTPSPNVAGFKNVPGRLFYPVSERNTNPNIPDPTTQLATHGFRNAGDVSACTDNSGP
jgi:hypothetical protein